MMTAEQAHLINMEDLILDKSERIEELSFFEIIQKVTDAFKRNKTINRIEDLIEKYPILKKTEFKAILTEDSSQKDKKTKIRKYLLKVFSEECLKLQYETSLKFFIAANLEADKLRAIINLEDRSFLNQIRGFDSLLVFTLKYGHVFDEKFFQTLDILLDAGVNVNIPDFNGKTAIDLVAEHYKNYESELGENLKQLGCKLLEKGACKELAYEAIHKFLKVLPEVVPAKADDLTAMKLFFWIGTNNQTKIIKNVNLVSKNIANYKNCETTILQFASRKSDKMSSVVKMLLDKGADPNETADLNKHTALELAAMENNEKNIKELLQSKKLKITNTIFSNFVQQSIKVKVFKMFLQSNTVEPTFIYEGTGNTPLHYAVYFSDPIAIQKLLKRPNLPLLHKNNSGKTILDIIDADNLETYFDSCLVKDSYKDDMSAKDYKVFVRLNFFVANNAVKSISQDANDSGSNLSEKCVIICSDSRQNVEQPDEMEVISQISKNKNLDGLLKHPLLYIFIMLKWLKVQRYYWIIVVLQGILFLGLSMSFYYLSNASEFYWWPICRICIFFFLLNMLLKIYIITEKLSDCWQYESLFKICEMLLMVTLFGSFFLVELRAFAFVEMSILFLLTMGYHPTISKWSVMVTKVFESFTILMMFFSLILIAFGAAFRILFKNDSSFYAFSKSILRTFVMITGEFNIDEDNFGHVGGYVLFVIFALFITLLLANFWIGVAVTDIDKIEKDAEVNALKNVVKFLVFVEKRIYRKKIFQRYLFDPFIFSTTINKEEDMVKKYSVDWYINRKNFKNRTIDMTFPEKIHQTCLMKYKAGFEQQKITVKLDKIMEYLQKLESKQPNFESINSKAGNTKKLN